MCVRRLLRFSLIYSLHVPEDSELKVLSFLDWSWGISTKLSTYLLHLDIFDTPSDNLIGRLTIFTVSSYMLCKRGIHENFICVHSDV